MAREYFAHMTPSVRLQTSKKGPSTGVVQSQVTNLMYNVDTAYS
jgi:hypothetical protein